MKRLLLATAAAALLLSSAATIAAPAPEKHGHDKDRGSDQRDRNRDDRHDDRYENRKGDHHDNGRHLGQKRKAWRHGEHLPREYWGPTYYVNDYRTYHLDAPPRGYRWVRPYRDDNQYVLIQISTGLIERIFGN